jgi:hypothetical protein
MPFERHIAFCRFALRRYREGPLYADKQPT